MSDPKTIVITYLQINERTRRKERCVSHGIDIESGKLKILPPVSPEELGATFDQSLGEYVLY